LVDIVTAECNDLRATLQRAVAKLEKAVDDLTAQAAKAIATERAVFRNLQGCRSEYKHWRERAVEAVEAGDFARLQQVLPRKNECQRNVAESERKCRAVCRTNRALQHRLRALGSQLAESKQRLAALPGQQAGVDSPEGDDGLACGPISGNGCLGLGSSRGEGSTGDSDWRAPVKG